MKPSNEAVFAAVDRAVWDAVDLAAYDALDRTLYQAVWWDVYWAVGDARNEDSLHPALQDYLGEVL